MTNSRQFGKASKTQELRPAQLKALLAIRDEVRVNKVPPTYPELALALGVTKNAAAQAIALLRRKGVLGTAPGRYRNIIITRKGMAIARRAAGAS